MSQRHRRCRSHGWRVEPPGAAVDDAFFYDALGMHDLGTSFEASQALGIDASSKYIIGYGQNGPDFGALWETIAASGCSLAPDGECVDYGEFVLEANAPVPSTIVLTPSLLLSLLGVARRVRR